MSIILASLLFYSIGAFNSYIYTNYIIFLFLYLVTSYIVPLCFITSGHRLGGSAPPANMRDLYSQQTSQHSSQQARQQSSQQTNQQSSQQASQQTSQQASQRSSQQASQQIRQLTSQQTNQQASQQASNLTRQQGDQFSAQQPPPQEITQNQPLQSQSQSNSVPKLQQQLSNSLKEVCIYTAIYVYVGYFIGYITFTHQILHPYNFCSFRNHCNIYIFSYEFDANILTKVSQSNFDILYMYIYMHTFFKRHLSVNTPHLTKQMDSTSQILMQLPIYSCLHIRRHLTIYYFNNLNGLGDMHC